jgi:hypothetical protein
MAWSQAILHISADGKAINNSQQEHYARTSISQCPYEFCWAVTMSARQQDLYLLEEVK